MQRYASSQSREYDQGVVEVLKVSQQIIEANRTASPNAAFGIYLTVFLLYFLVCWPISLLAGYLEKKWK